MLSLQPFLNVTSYSKQFSHYVLLNVNSHIIHLQINLDLNIGEGQKKLEHSAKYLLSWLRRHDMKNPQFQSSVSTKFDEYGSVLKPKFEL